MQCQTNVLFHSHNMSTTHLIASRRGSDLFWSSVWCQYTFFGLNSAWNVHRSTCTLPFVTTTREVVFTAVCLSVKLLNWVYWRLVSVWDVGQGRTILRERRWGIILGVDVCFLSTVSSVCMALWLLNTALLTFISYLHLPNLDCKNAIIPNETTGQISCISSPKLL